MRTYLNDIKNGLMSKFANEITAHTVIVYPDIIYPPKKDAASLCTNIRYGCMVMGIDIQPKSSDEIEVSFFVRSIPNVYLESVRIPMSQGVWRYIEMQNKLGYKTRKFTRILVHDYRVFKCYDKNNDSHGLVVDEIYQISQLLGPIS